MADSVPSVLGCTSWVDGRDDHSPKAAGTISASLSSLTRSSVRFGVTLHAQPAAANAAVPISTSRRVPLTIQPLATGIAVHPPHQRRRCGQAQARTAGSPPWNAEILAR